MLIDWRRIAKEIYEDLKIKVSNSGKKITLGAILVGDNKSSLNYIKQKKKWVYYIGINFVLKRLDYSISTKLLLEEINDFNNSEDIDWFIVQLPLPNHIDENSIIESISPLKDVDGFHPINVWKLMIWDDSWFHSCTPSWIMEIFRSEKIEFIWKNVVVIWKSNIVWKPISNLLINAWATVTVCNSKTKDLSFFTKNADIIIVAAWVPWLLNSNMINSTSIIIDVWFTVIDWKIYWDADTKNIDSLWAKITPVPGWVWALTVASLMSNTIKASEV